MTALRPSHLRIIPATSADTAGLPAGPEPDISLLCHRRHRGPYTGGGTLLREHVVPELLEHAADRIASRRIEIIALAPELESQVPAPPSTLTERAQGLERTRYYNVGRTRLLAHGVAELLTDWAKACRPDGVIIEFRELGQADPTDLELIGILLRRCDPALLTLLITGYVADDDRHVIPLLTTYTQPVAGRPDTRPHRAADADLAQIFIDSDGTDPDPAVRQAYTDLPADERARRHTTRAEVLAALGEPTLRLGAIPFHLERGLDPSAAGGAAIFAAHDDCYTQGFYDAALELAQRGRQVISPGEQPKWYKTLSQRAASSLCYLGRGEEAFSHLAAIRRDSIDPDAHMNSCYQEAMLYTRYLPPDARDHEQALAWINIAITIADRHPEPRLRIFYGAFMRNACALVELHRGNIESSLALVNEAIRMADGLESGEHLLHRSVLVFNRAAILVTVGDHAAALRDYDELIHRDPEYCDYYFERAGVRRKVGWYEGALEDYERSLSLSPPLCEVYHNRADMLHELGDDESALRDLDYALELEPDLVDSLINRADVLLAQGETDRATADIEHGLTLEPGNPHLLAARAALLAEAGDELGAWASYTAALREDPDFVAALANRAVLAYALGRTKAAVDDLDHAIQLNNDASLRVNRAIALQDLGDHRRALDDLDIAVTALGDNDPALLYRRGLSRHAMHDTDGALADWRAHLAAYGPDETSPYVTQIKRYNAGLIAGAEVPESVA